MFIFMVNYKKDVKYVKFKKPIINIEIKLGVLRIKSITQDFSYSKVLHNKYILSLKQNFIDKLFNYLTKKI